MWKSDVDINRVVELRVKPNVYFGFGAINKIEEIARDLKTKGIDKILVVSGRNAYKSSGAWDVIEKALKANDIAYTNYAEVTPNPTADAVDAAAKQGKEFGAKASSQAIENFFYKLSAKLKEEGFKKYIIAGGETSGQVTKALKVKGFYIGPTIAPGVPWVKAVNENISLALKSGNFGEIDFFNQAQGKF